MLAAVNPMHAVRLLRCATASHGFLVLGAVFLVVTGGEALYADMGHFGERPIRLAWFMRRAAGAAAQLLRPGRAADRQSAAPRDNPFFRLAPAWALYPLVALATVATVIASQAVISGAFSLTRQAVQLGYCPRVEIDHTSPGEIGQIYIPGSQLAADGRAPSAWCSGSASRPTWPPPTASR